MPRSFGQSRFRGNGALPLATARSHVLSALSRDRARCLLGFASPAFGDNVNVLGGSAEYSGNAPVLSGGTKVP